MKILQKLSLLSAAIAVLSAVSCVNEPFSGEGQEADGPIASVEQQIVYVKSSASLISSVQTGIDKMVEDIENDALAASLETLYDEFTNRGDALEDHIGFLRNGASWLEATMATLEQQKALAYVNGALYAAVDKEELKVAFESHLKAPLAELAESADKWIGASYETYYSVAQTAGTLDYLLTLAGRQLGGDKGGLEGLLSDVEAGLRDGAEPSEFKALISVVDGNASALEQLHATVQSVVAELEAEYAKAFEAALSGSGDYSAKTLKKANTKASAELQNATTSLNDLVARIEDCEADIEALKTKVGELEADVDELLGMIQSVTFLSEYSEEYVIAHYSMGTDIVTDYSKPYYGKCVREPSEKVELNYMIRPASAAAAVTKDVVSVVGYYADRIQTKAIDPTNFVNFTVTDVSVTNADRGIVTVKVNHDLKDDFYYRETGAKCALFIATGKTDVSSKFVEMFPKDISTDVYVESIVPSSSKVEIKKGETLKLSATINPSDATNKAYFWTSDDTTIADINNDGELTAIAPGTTKIHVTSRGTDEWGLPLTASIDVVVNEAVTINGPNFIIVGNTANMVLEFPASLSVTSQVWEVSNENMKDKETVYATVTNDGVVTGRSHTYIDNEYKSIVIKCTVNNEITVRHEMPIVVPQVTGMKFNGVELGKDQLSMKYDVPTDVHVTVEPSEAAEFFDIQYTAGTDVYGWIDLHTGFINNKGEKNFEQVRVTAIVVNKHGQTYLAPKYWFGRSITVNIEPYYIQDMWFAQDNISLAPGKTTKLEPQFTSDVEGRAPTYTDLEWSSSNTNVVKVSDTGEIETIAEGSAIIKATTKNSLSIRNGEEHKSAHCTVVVSNPTIPVNVGDYFYSDGSWSSELNLNTDDDKEDDRSVIGIVIYDSPVVSDTRMMGAYPSANHGLVLGLSEFESTFGEHTSDDFNANSSYQYFLSNSLPLPPKADADHTIMGYTYTSALKGYREARGGGEWAKLVTVLDNVGVSLPNGCSSWYIPSFAEMVLIKNSMTRINSSLEEARGIQVTNVNYWSSTLQRYDDWRTYNDLYAQSFNMTTGTWNDRNNKNNKTEKCKVRVVFAF